MSLHRAYRGGSSKGLPGWWLHFDFDAQVVEYIKAYKWPDEREWDEAQKRWWVSETIAEQVAAFLPGFEAHLRQKALL